MGLHQLEMSLLVPDVSLLHFSPSKLKFLLLKTIYLSSGIIAAI